MRTILHVDLNAFYASVEQALNPELMGRPVAVAGDPNKRNGIVLTASYEARKCGVKTAMALWQVKELCPDIIFVRPRYRRYSEFSRRVIEIVKDYSPLYEQFSIDEVWADVTGCERLFGDGETIAYAIKEKIKTNLGITASVGVSYCKLMAKMASDLKKPDAVSVVMQDDISKKIWPLPVRDLIGVGKKVEPKLNALGIYTIGDLAQSPLSVLEKLMGKFGKYLWYFANGLDGSVVNKNVYFENIKGMGNSTTTPRDLITIDEVRETLLSLSESVSSRLREGGYKGRVVEISVRGADFTGMVRQKKIDRYTDLTMDIFTVSEELFRMNWPRKTPVRLLGVRMSGLKKAESYDQLSLFNDEYNAKNEMIDVCLDGIRDRFGYTSVFRASLMVNDTKMSYMNDEEWVPMKAFRR